MPMRSELVDNYFNQVMKGSNEQTGVFREIYRNVMDNRIFNNLKQQLNEMIEDEKALIQVEEFRKMFFTFFKGEIKASNIYDKLLPQIIVWSDGENVYNDTVEIPAYISAEVSKMVSIQKLSLFIDGFNFTPVKVSNIHFKNGSTEMTYIMSSNVKGSLAEGDKTIKWHEKSDGEKHLLKLLSLVSFKINERFRNMREAFRYIDTDHSQSISINEFAQAIEYFRLKLSFEDIQKLYRFLDCENKGELGYDDFTLLSEERWKNLDPYKHYQESLEKYKNQQQDEKSSTSSMRLGNSHASTMGIKSNDAAGYQMLESLAKNHLKIPI